MRTHAVASHASTPTARLELAENQVIRLPRRHGATVVRVERGTVLVTRGGDREDHVLEPGDELVLPRGGVAVAWAFTSAIVSVRDGLRVIPPSEPAPGAVLEQLGLDVAHELKNPLAAVKALAQLGLRDPREAPAHARLGMIEHEVERMQELLQRRLSSARTAAPTRPTPARATHVELGPLVSRILLSLSALASIGQVRLTARGDATVEAEPRRIEEALLNLVANAIEATPPGGAVAVEVRQAGKEVEVAVQDTGRGMASDTLARVGTPFFTTREHGSGLGVVLARSVLTDHGGSLRYESAPGRGTTAVARLPGGSHEPPHAA
jgi:signal transduction histidine kinase